MATPHLRAESLEHLRALAHDYVRSVDRPVASPELAGILFESNGLEDSVSPLLIRTLLRPDRRFRERGEGTWELLESRANAMPLASARFAIVDIEATGSNPQWDRVIEIAVVVVERLEVVEQMTTLINPERRIPAWIRRLTGIEEADLQDAPRFHQIAPRIESMLEGAIFVAHNVGFDSTFLRHHLLEAGRSPDPWPSLCTVRLSQRAFPGLASYRLSSLSRRLGVGLENHHRARDDALATARILIRTLQAGSIPRSVRTVGQLLDFAG